jgi:hypothetical protein
MTSSKIAVIAAVALFAIASSVSAHDHGKDKTETGGDKEVTGEIVDLMCYVDHAATGPDHAKCAGTCIKNGGPVVITSNGKTYLVVGEHKTINDELAPFAGKTITLRGKVAERDGMALLENAEVVKK